MGKNISNSELKNIAYKIRIDIIKMLNKAGSGHTAGALGLTDIYSVLYFDLLNHNPKIPKWDGRDFVILSNGHTCPVLYATLANAGYFDVKKLDTLRKLDSKMQGHPHIGSLPGIENTSGPLGQGISTAVGLSVSLLRDKKKNKVFCFVGDGELQEGQCWEAALFAGKEKLDNLYVIIDRNCIQIDGNTENVCALDSISKKFVNFNFAVIEFDGNDISQIKHAFKEAFKIKNKPICLIANTTPGKGVSFIENKFEWHGKVPNNEETKLAISELEKNINK